jgi:hypothetical protein
MAIAFNGQATILPAHRPVVMTAPTATVETAAAPARVMEASPSGSSVHAVDVGPSRLGHSWLTSPKAKSRPSSGRRSSGPPTTSNKSLSSSSGSHRQSGHRHPGTRFSADCPGHPRCGMARRFRPNGAGTGLSTGQEAAKLRWLWTIRIHRFTIFNC